MKSRFTPTEFVTNLVTKSLFKKWKNNCPFPEKEWAEFLSIWDMISETILDEVVNQTDGVRLGFYIGDLSCKYVPVEDVKEKYSRKTPLNLTTGGKVGKIVFSVKTVAKWNKYASLYGFKGCTRLSKKVSKQLKNNPQKFKDYSIKKSGVFSKLNKIEQSINNT